MRPSERREQTIRIGESSRVSPDRGNRRLAEISATQPSWRHQRILAHAATQLRTGKGAESVLAEVREQSPELLQDYCKIHVTLTSPPLRPVPRVAASA